LACLNGCGGKYLKDLHGDFERKLTEYNRQILKIE
jgi:hypothetical protein